LLQREVAKIKAVDGVSFEIKKGEALGLVGESGCGKTTVARSLLKLVEVTSGSIEFDGQIISDKNSDKLKSYRRRVSAIFQDPFSSLNPRMTVGQILSEVLKVNRYENDFKERVSELLRLCGLAERFVDLYPHEMSGGQRQRVGIARALALEPELIICDEAVSALDVSIQAQIVNLLRELRDSLGLSFLFIGHDLSVVQHLCDRIAVMYLGKIVEIGNAEDLFKNPAHPYTKALIDAVPSTDPDEKRFNEEMFLQGEVPSPLSPPSGCVFHTRCRHAVAACATKTPAMEQVDIGQNRMIACLMHNEIGANSHHKQ
jgi:oligopeptide/dipeptide ABC transporter ATP-binding protein